MKKLGMLIGGLISAFGISIMATPLRTYFLIGWIAGAVFLVNGLSLLFSGMSKRNKNSGKCVVGAVTTFIGTTLLVTDLSQILTQTIIIYIVAGGILLSGIIEIIIGYSYVKNGGTAKTIVFGLISAVIGIIGLLFKQTTLIMLGIIVGYHVLRVGISIFSYAKNIDKPIILDN